jgi:hypothetical protein
MIDLPISTGFSGDELGEPGSHPSADMPDGAYWACEQPERIPDHSVTAFDFGCARCRLACRLFIEARPDLAASWPGSPDGQSFVGIFLSAERRFSRAE